MYFRKLIFFIVALTSAPLFAAENPGYESPKLTLRAALARALRNNPTLAGFDYEQRAVDARILQAGLKPNPELGFDAENVASQRGTGIFNATEATLQLSQLLELGGKREARIREAEAGRALVRFDYEEKRLDVMRSVTSDFIAALAAQRKIELQKEVVTLAEKVGEEITRRIQVGRASIEESARNDVALATARLGLESAKREMENARRQLAGQWGAKTLDAEMLEGDMQTIPDAPKSLDSYLDRIDRHPSVARWEAEAVKRHAAVVKEQANARPDITVGGGARWQNETNNATLVGSVSIPLPLHNRNQGAIVEAQTMEAKVSVERRAAERALSTEIREAYGKLVIARATAQTLTDTVLPSAQKAVDAVLNAYTAGKSSQLEILESQRTLIEARTQNLEALVAYHQAAAELDALTGGEGASKASAKPQQPAKKK